MELIIEVDKKYYEACKDAVKESYPSQIEEIIANGTPYNPTGDLINREALKTALTSETRDNFEFVCLSRVLEKIDNAQTVPQVTVFAETADEKAVADLKAELQSVIEARPQGECRTCRHRDPEDKKCDCGALERHGCSFPVSDDYYCKFYEKGSTE